MVSGIGRPEKDLYREGDPERPLGMKDVVLSEGQKYCCEKDVFEGRPPRHRFRCLLPRLLYGDP